MKKIDYMIDVETLGLTEKPVVLSISFVAFDINSGEHFPDKSYTLYPNIPEQVKLGFGIDSSTIEWWMGSVKNAKAFTHVLNKNSIGYTNIDDFYGVVLDLVLNNGCGINRFWATSPLDYLCLSNLLEASKKGGSHAIPYNRRMCARTIAEMSMIKTGSHEKTYPSHDSYNDCLIQIKDLCNNINNICLVVG